MLAAKGLRILKFTGKIFIHFYLCKFFPTLRKCETLFHYKINE
jgi:hypothetical protein